MNIRELKYWMVGEEDANGCWPWLGYCDPRGYPRVKFEGKMWKAHRLSFFLSNDCFINPDLDVDHECWNIRCVNPDHLQQMTNAENIKRRIENNAECIQGHPFDEENTGYTGKRRYCRECAKIANRKSYHGKA